MLKVQAKKDIVKTDITDKDGVLVASFPFIGSFQGDNGPYTRTIYYSDQTVKKDICWW